MNIWWFTSCTHARGILDLYKGICNYERVLLWLNGGVGSVSVMPECFVLRWRRYVRVERDYNFTHCVFSCVGRRRHGEEKEENDGGNDISNVKNCAWLSRQTKNYYLMLAVLLKAVLWDEKESWRWCEQSWLATSITWHIRRVSSEMWISDNRKQAKLFV